MNDRRNSANATGAHNGAESVSKRSAPALALGVSLLAATLFAASGNAVAHDEPLVYDQADFSVSAGREVANDRLVAVLFAQAQGEKQSTLADEVNKTIAWGVQQAKGVEGIKVSTLGYRSSPLYRDQRLTGWQVRQSIRLETLEPARLSDLLSTLQSKLGLESVSYDVSPKRRKEVETELISEALAEFRARADLVAEQMGRSGYRIVRFSVNTSTGGAPVPMMRGRAMAMAEAQSVAAPTLEGGDQRIEVNVNGAIELELAR